MVKGGRHQLGSGIGSSNGILRSGSGSLTGGCLLFVFKTISGFVLLLLLLIFWFRGNTCNIDTINDLINVQSLMFHQGTTTNVTTTNSDGDDGASVVDVIQHQQTHQRRQEAPYGEYCETRPRNERQLWNTRKKVIAFALFVPKKLANPQPTSVPTYFMDGLAGNIRQQQLYYPDWITRIYTLNLSDEQIQQVIDVDHDRIEVVKCHQDSPLNQLDNARKMITRFLVVDDPTVEYSIIRDLDSRPSIRELLAVNEWMSSGLGFHSMRDHRYHSVPVMGGMFGMKRGVFDSLNTTMTSIARKAIAEHPNRAVPGCCKDDQNFLARYVWDLVKSNAMEHDMDHGRRCKQYGSKVCRVYPTGVWEESAFVGLPFNEEVPNVGRNTHFDCTMTCKADHETEYIDVHMSNQVPKRPSAAAPRRSSQ
jgi:hypothetical protein